MTALAINNLTVELPAVARRPLVADVTLQVGAGEVVGLVGESGSGKSVTARAALGLFPPSAQVTGSVRVAGTEVVGLTGQALRRLRAEQVAMVFQDPRASINPLRRVGDFLTEALRANRGWSKAKALTRAVELLTEVGIAQPGVAVRKYPHQFSGGMLQRVMIASALAVEPVLLLADEPTTALDVTTQAEILATLLSAQAERAMAMLFVTHDLELAATICDRIAVMYAGRIVEEQPAQRLFDAPQHPYTRGLLTATPKLPAGGDAASSDVAPLVPVAGRPLSLAENPAGCAFAPRCPIVVDDCAAATPVTRVRDGASVACHRADELIGRDA
ncbi:ABC transporter ATP-binding protein [Micromonospora phytophila]|uniref:ABC transporter ATP-binding protein n=1 Tax=Micromonospora phytophila TaxID=709888 RepID=UPI00202FF720|nr:ABC transporter ATP-binding protein [Micromonospora phytophila]MCM0673309.1 ABC transporter ATP-binding protein [Micromonospora phytophila]